MNAEIQTARLLLRPLRDTDAEALTALAGNWDVARMTARIPHPYPKGLAERWITEQAAARESGDAFAFAILLVGLVGLERKDGSRYELGYWIGEPWWGQGLATEAASAAVRFAFEALGADTLEAGWLFDNTASGRVLAKCGFVRSGETMQWCEARGQAVKCHRLTLAADRRRPASELALR